jgi:hypothetical protein
VCDSSPHPAHVSFEHVSSWPRLRNAYVVCLPDGCGFDELQKLHVDIVSAIEQLLKEAGIVA